MEVHYTLRQLQYLVAVAHSGTMSAAAARCHVSQSALSLAISQLERSLGVKLFVRRRAKGAELTAAGMVVLEQAENLLRQAGELQVQIEIERGGDLHGTLPIGCYTGLAPLYIPPLLTGFKKLCPGVSLEFSEGAQPDLLRELSEGGAELALVFDTNLDPEFERIIVDELEAYVLLPENHRLANEPAVSLLDLSDEEMILVDVPPSRENWAQNMEELGLELKVGYSSHSVELVRCLVGRGFGYAPLFLRPPLNRTYEGNTVVPRPIVENVRPLRVALSYPAGATLSTRARRFAEYAYGTLRGKRSVGEKETAEAQPPTPVDSRN